MNNNKYGAGVGGGGAKRFSKHVEKNPIFNITKGDIRRLARRGGIKRISQGIYEEARIVMIDFLERILRDTIIYAEHADRRTIMTQDLIYALKKNGRNILGFGI
jgi:histone H4